MRQRSRRAPTAPTGSTEPHSAFPTPLSASLEPSRLERIPSPPRTEGERSELARLLSRLLLASTPVFAAPACLGHDVDPRKSFGLDSGTVGHAELPVEAPEGEAA